MQGFVGRIFLKSGTKGDITFAYHLVCFEAYLSPYRFYRLSLFSVSPVFCQYESQSIELALNDNVARFFLDNVEIIM